jgi:hypothetical protein
MGGKRDEIARNYLRQCQRRITRGIKLEGKQENVKLSLRLIN